MYKYVKQQNLKDCGVACLYNIIKYYKGSIPITKLRKKLNVTEQGTSVYDIVKTSNELGLESSAYKCELNDLCNLTLPIIAHIKVDNKFEHFVIIDKIIDDELCIFDPLRGYLKETFENFENEWTNIIITFNKTGSIVKEREKNYLFDYIIHVSKNSKIIFLILFISVCSSVISIIHSLFLSYLFKTPAISINLFIIFGVMCLLKLIFDYIRNINILKYIKNYDFNITKNTYHKILSLPLKYHNNRPIGDTVSRINDLSSIKEFLNYISFSLIIDLIYILMISIILFIINKFMFILTFIISCIYILLYLLFRNKINNYSLLNKENFSHANNYIIESLLGLNTIKNLNIENKKYKNFKKIYTSFLKSNYKLNNLIMNFNILEDFVCNIASIIIVFIGIIFYKNHIISLSNIISFNTLVIYLFISLKNIISLDEIIIDAKNAATRLDELNSETNENLSSQPITKINSILFHNIKFSYNSFSNIINNITFKINKNDKILITGGSGSGKSTLFKLLTKQLDISRDMIKINNIDINDIDRKDIIDNICYVSQNEYIFTDTILNNIKLYKEATEEEIDKVIKITNIDNLLKKRNIKLDFLLEENGQNLSGGERQRIILARSLLQNKKVLILDETMNELDIVSERKILKKIITEYNITLILISHRKNNSDLFNKIIKI